MPHRHRGEHLQYSAGRRPPRRRRLDRGRVSLLALRVRHGRTTSTIAKSWCARPTRTASSRPCSRRRYTRPRCSRSMPSISRSRGVRERVREPMAGEIRLQWWRDVLERRAGRRGRRAPGRGRAARHRRALRAAAEPLRDLIEARAFDLYDEPMPTLAALEAYARQTAAAVFGLAARICGARRAPSRRRRSTPAWPMRSPICCAVSRATRRARQVFVPAELLERTARGSKTVTAGLANEGLLAGTGGVAGRRAPASRGVRAAAAGTCRPPRCRHCCRSRWCPAISVRWSGRLRPVHTPVEVAQWRRQWALWRAARRYVGTMRGELNSIPPGGARGARADMLVSRGLSPCAGGPSPRSPMRPKLESTKAARRSRTAIGRQKRA